MTTSHGHATASIGDGAACQSVACWNGARLQQLRLGEAFALQLQADRQSLASKPQGSRSPAMPVRLPAIVKMSFRYICTGSSLLAPI
jgi:hypothetical protein